jgi:hypothetical protein
VERERLGIGELGINFDLHLHKRKKIICIHILKLNGKKGKKVAVRPASCKVQKRRLSKVADHTIVARPPFVAWNANPINNCQG